MQEEVGGDDEGASDTELEGHAGEADGGIGAAGGGAGGGTVCEDGEADRRLPLLLIDDVYGDLQAGKSTQRTVYSAATKKWQPPAPPSRRESGVQLQPPAVTSHIVSIMLVPRNSNPTPPCSHSTPFSPQVCSPPFMLTPPLDLHPPPSCPHLGNQQAGDHRIGAEGDQGGRGGDEARRGHDRGEGQHT